MRNLFEQDYETKIGLGGNLNMNHRIKMVAVDIDGTFVHSDYTYDTSRFRRILSRMKEAGCHFVVASGNQYEQLRDLFSEYGDEISFVAENGAFVKDHGVLIFTAKMSKETVEAVIETCREYSEISNVMCGLKSAYCQRGTVDQDFFNLTSIYYHQLKWVDDFKNVDDQILKFAPTVPEEKTDVYYDMFCKRLGDKIEPTSSGHGSIDLIIPGCHKASGIIRLAERWGITSEQCAAFGDGENDIEMLKYCKYSYAMENSSQNVKNAARHICKSNEEDGVLVTLEELFL